jgi:hypothetical protein
MVSNGNGRTQTANDNDKYLWSARLMWQPNGATRMNQWGSGVLLTEGDLDSTDKPLFALAANVLDNDRRNTTTSIDNKDFQWSLDYTFKYKGFGSVAEYHDRESTPEEGGKFKDKGFLIQASYAIKAKTMGPAAFWELRAATRRSTPAASRGMTTGRRSAWR